MTGTWWRRNRFWLLALLPLLALALATSSFRVTRLYLDWQWSRPIDPRGVSGTLDQRYEELDGIARDHRVQVKVLGVSPVDEAPHPSSTRQRLLAAPGGQLWKISLLMKADAQVPLRTCHLALEDAGGNVYDTGGSLVERDGQHYSRISESVCTPDFGPGPVYDVVKREWDQGPSPLPPVWAASDVVVLPVGVRPTAVRVGWHQPQYLRLSVPS